MSDMTVKWQEWTPEQRNMFVAEKIMGWTQWQPCDCTEADLVRNVGYYRDIVCRVCGRDIEEDEGTEHSQEKPPRYSESLDAAFKMVVHVIGKHSNTYERARAFFAELGKVEGPVHVIMSWADFRDLTADKLCIAALRAMGYEVIE